MLDGLFLSVLNMSITASLVILVVLLVRFLLKKAPKNFAYALWAVVLFRLVCPFSFESAIGLLPINKTPIPQDDEAVMRKTDTDIRAEYAKSLLRFATGRKFIAATPLAFGEGDTKERVKNVMQYKKPMIGMVIILIVLVAGLITVLGTNKDRTINTPENLNVSENQGVSDFKGVELYIWKNDMSETYFTLLSGTNRNKTEEEIYDKSVATTDMSEIVNTLLGFDDGLHLFIMQMNETDFTKEEMVAFEQKIIEGIGDNIKNYNISIGVFNSSNGSTVSVEDIPVGENSDNLKEAVDISKQYDEMQTIKWLLCPVCGNKTRSHGCQLFAFTRRIAAAQMLDGTAVFTL